MNPFVTVIIRSMGRPSIERALASLAGQTHRAIEVLVIDATGGSHPRLATRCGEFPLRMVSLGRRLNRPQAGNAGLQHAHGEWLIFLDDDDFFGCEHIELLLECALATNVHTAYAGTRLLDANDNVIGELNEPYARLKLLAGNFIQMGAMLFHRSLLQRGCEFDEQMLLYQDWDFWLQLSWHTHFAHSPKLTNNWRVHSGKSGAGTGANANPALQREFEQRVKLKWRGRHIRLIRFVQDTSHRAAGLLVTRPARAARILRRALLLMPNDPTLTNLLGLANFHSGDVTGAWYAFSAALVLLPNNESITRNLARAADSRLRRTVGGVK
ncbi:MAG: glycosyltransferase [Betaproteobacteria bacterium]